MPDQRPAGAQRPVDELVDELDREQQGNGAAEAAGPEGLAGCARHDQLILGVRQAEQPVAHVVEVQHLDVGDLAQAPGEHVFEWFLRNKRREWEEYRTLVTPFEVERYFPLL